MQRAKLDCALGLALELLSLSQCTVAHDLHESVQIAVPMLDRIQRLLDGLDNWASHVLLTRK